MQRATDEGRLEHSSSLRVSLEIENASRSSLPGERPKARFLSISYFIALVKGCHMLGAGAKIIIKQRREREERNAMWPRFHAVGKVLAREDTSARGPSNIDSSIASKSICAP